MPHSDICWLAIKKLVALQSWQVTCKGNVTLTESVLGR